MRRFDPGLGLPNLDYISPNIFWYIVGYIATDGSLSKDGRHVSISSKDYEHLENIKNQLGITSKIISKAREKEGKKKYYVLGIGGVSNYRFLNSIGIFSRKTWSMGVLKIDEKYFADFLRGCIDGDGCIYSWKHRSNNHTQWSLRIFGAAPKFMYWLKEMTENKFLVSGKLHIQNYEHRSTMYIIKFGKLASQKILKEVYYPNCLCLERKMITVGDCLQDDAKMVQYGNVIRPGGETGQTQQT